MLQLWCDPVILTLIHMTEVDLGCVSTILTMFSRIIKSPRSRAAERTATNVFPGLHRGEQGAARAGGDDWNRDVKAEHAGIYDERHPHLRQYS